MVHPTKEVRLISKNIINSMIIHLPSYSALSKVKVHQKMITMRIFNVVIRYQEIIKASPK